MLWQYCNLDGVIKHLGYDGEILSKRMPVCDVTTKEVDEYSESVFALISKKESEIVMEWWMISNKEVGGLLHMAV